MTTRTTSTLGPARAALFAMLAADAGLADAQVTFGPPEAPTPTSKAAR